MLRERGYIGGAFPQRRERNPENIQPVIEILPKQTLFHLLAQVDVRGRDDANVEPDPFVSAQPLDFFSWRTRSNLA